MLKAFPSAQSNITEDSPRVYLFAVEEYSLEALKRACRAIVRGEVKDLKPEFPPAAPKLAQIVKDCEDRLKVERYEASHMFVEVGSVLWEKMILLRNDRGLLAYERTLPNGHRVKGWFFKPEEVHEADKVVLPAPVDRARLANAGFSVGDPQGQADAA